MASSITSGVTAKGIFAQPLEGTPCTPIIIKGVKTSYMLPQRQSMILENIVSPIKTHHVIDKNSASPEAILYSSNSYDELKADGFVLDVPSRSWHKPNLDNPLYPFVWHEDRVPTNSEMRSVGYQPTQLYAPAVISQTQTEAKNIIREDKIKADPDFQAQLKAALAKVDHDFAGDDKTSTREHQKFMVEQALFEKHLRHEIKQEIQAKKLSQQDGQGRAEPILNSQIFFRHNEDNLFDPYLWVSGYDRHQVMIYVDEQNAKDPFYLFNAAHKFIANEPISDVLLQEHGFNTGRLAMRVLPDEVSYLYWTPGQSLQQLQQQEIRGLPNLKEGYQYPASSSLNYMQMVNSIGTDRQSDQVIDENSLKHAGFQPIKNSPIPGLWARVTQVLNHQGRPLVQVWIPNSNMAYMRQWYQGNHRFLGPDLHLPPFLPDSEFDTALHSAKLNHFVISPAQAKLATSNWFTEQGLALAKPASPTIDSLHRYQTREYRLRSFSPTVPIGPELLTQQSQHFDSRQIHTHPSSTTSYHPRHLDSQDFSRHQDFGRGLRHSQPRTFSASHASTRRASFDNESAKAQARSSLITDSSKSRTRSPSPTRSMRRQSTASHDSLSTARATRSPSPSKSLRHEHARSRSASYADVATQVRKPSMRDATTQVRKPSMRDASSQTVRETRAHSPKALPFYPEFPVPLPFPFSSRPAPLSMMTSPYAYDSKGLLAAGMALDASYHHPVPKRFIPVFPTPKPFPYPGGPLNPRDYPELLHYSQGATHRQTTEARHTASAQARVRRTASMQYQRGPCCTSEMQSSRSRPLSPAPGGRVRHYRAKEAFPLEFMGYGAARARVDHQYRHYEAPQYQSQIKQGTTMPVHQSTSACFRSQRPDRRRGTEAFSGWENPPRNIPSVRYDDRVRSTTRGSRVQLSFREPQNLAEQSRPRSPSPNRRK